MTMEDPGDPPRIAPRNLFDLSLGEDNIFNGDKRKWSIRLSAINLTNKEALYNFLSTFSGTHYVTPRAGRWRTPEADAGFVLLAGYFAEPIRAFCKCDNCSCTAQGASGARRITTVFQPV